MPFGVRQTNYLLKSYNGQSFHSDDDQTSDDRVDNPLGKKTVATAVNILQNG